MRSRPYFGLVHSRRAGTLAFGMQKVKPDTAKLLGVVMKFALGSGFKAAVLTKRHSQLMG
jgi:hypothetical protein